MKAYRVLIIFFAICVNLFPQIKLYDGPLKGQVSNVVVTNTNQFLKTLPKSNDTIKHVRNKISLVPLTESLIADNINGFKNIFIEDVSSNSQNKSYSSIKPILYEKFEGITETNSIPPDPYVAVGKNHIISVVNSSFRIMDKKGKTIVTINADEWYRGLQSNVGAFDPKVVYDHYADRWIMVWLHQNDNLQEGLFLISVSDDDNPLGVWYNWKTPSTLNGNTYTNSWGDYQGVGYDDKYLYITANQFSFGGAFVYARVRVYDKQKLYAQNPSAIDWQDFWNIREPGSANLVFGIRPTRHYSSNWVVDKYYLVNIPFASLANYVTIFWIEGAYDSLKMNAKNISVSQFRSAPNANQLGGSSILIEAGGSQLRNEPIYKDGYIYLAHSIADPTRVYSYLRFLKIDPISSTVIEDLSLGKTGYWYFYNALALDNENNVYICYSRSGLDEYIGAYFSVKPANQPLLSNSVELMKGLGNYVKDYNTGRNRWGDYNGAWTDPVNPENIHLFVEYAAGTNRWGTYNGWVRLKPFENPYALTFDREFNLGEVEIGKKKNYASFAISNMGNQLLQISDIAFSNSSFKLTQSLSFPFSLAFYDTLKLQIEFDPNEPASYIDSMIVRTNDPQKPFIAIKLFGKGYEIKPANYNVLYASAGAQSEGVIFKINPLDGSTQTIGKPNVSEFLSLTTNSNTGELYGLYGNNKIYRINAAKGDAYLYFNAKIGLRAIAYDKTTNRLYGLSQNSDICILNENTGDTIHIAKISNFLVNFTIDPSTGQMWASSTLGHKRGRDALFKVNKENGDTVFVGKTGFNSIIRALAFDNNGNLFAVWGGDSQNSTFAKINTENGSASKIIDFSYLGVKGLAFGTNSQISVKDSKQEEIPKSYFLYQNYPNPFNPTTIIKFDLPQRSYVTLKIYDALGKMICEIFNGYLEAGSKEIIFEGKNLSSGIYFYELTTENFRAIKKMILVR